MQTELTVATAASKRLKMDGRSILTLMSYVGNALNNLARKVANDPPYRPYLMSDPDTTTLTIATSGQDYVADMAPILDVPQTMVDCLKFGTIFWSYNTTFVPGNVSVLNSTITFSGGSFRVGDAVRVGNGTGVLPAGLAQNTTYYVRSIQSGASQVITFSTTLGGDLLDLEDVGSGIMTIQTWQKTICQWLGSPNQGSLGPSLPLAYVYYWLQGTVIYLSGVTAGTLSFNTPFIPTLDTLPEILESDLIDMVVQLAITQGFEPQTEAER